MIARAAAATLPGTALTEALQMSRRRLEAVPVAGLLPTRRRLSRPRMLHQPLRLPLPRVSPAATTKASLPALGGRSRGPTRPHHRFPFLLPTATAAAAVAAMMINTWLVAARRLWPAAGDHEPRPAPPCPPFLCPQRAWSLSRQVHFCSSVAARQKCTWSDSYGDAPFVRPCGHPQGCGRGGNDLARPGNFSRAGLWSH